MRARTCARASTSGCASGARVVPRNGASSAGARAGRGFSSRRRRAGSVARIVSARGERERSGNRGGVDGRGASDRVARFARFSRPRSRAVREPGSERASRGRDIADEASEPFSRDFPRSFLDFGGRNGAWTSEDEGSSDGAGYGRGFGSLRTDAGKRAAWALALLTAAYCHASATGFLLPSLLPAMSLDLKLDDEQGAALTTLFTVVYSLLLPFIGVLADTVDRKNLLAAGAATWTMASFMTAHSENFPALVLSRGLFAIGNGAQNPVAFSMIPELFPRNKALALSVYNLAIHAGRAVSFASGAFVGRAATPPGAEVHVFSNEPLTLPLTYLTEIGALGAHTILYTTADSVVLTPNVGTVLENTVGEAILSSGMSWHEIFDFVALPGLFIAPLILLTISDPGRTPTGSRTVKRRRRAEERRRRKERNEMFKELPSIDNGGLIALLGASIDEMDLRSEERRIKVAERAAAAQQSMAGKYTSIPIQPKVEDGLFSSMRSCFESTAFQKVTAAATLTDVASWSMIAFQAAFYERVFSLSPAEYDPLLALVIPLAGVVGGLGGGWICDRLQAQGPTGQRWFISLMTIAAGPLLAASILAEDYKVSLAFLFPGILAAEVFRAPTAIMTRETRPDTPSVAAATHLAVRNMIAGAGPLAVAALAHKYDLQHALLLAPAFYVVAGIVYFDAIGALTAEKQARVEASLVRKRF